MLKVAPDATKCVSVKDAEDKAETVTRQGAGGDTAGIGKLSIDLCRTAITATT